MGQNGMYSLSELVRQSRLPRSTIRYYQEIGLLSNPDTDSIYRFTYADCQRLDEIVLLRNIGYDNSEIVDYVLDHAMSYEHINMHIDWLDKKMTYIAAQKMCLENYAMLYERKDEVWVEDIEPYLIKKNSPSWRSNEIVYHEEGPLELPISSGAAWLEGSDYEHPEHIYLARAVPLQYAALIDGYSDVTDVVGNCKCLCSVYTDYLINLDLLIDNNLVLKSFEHLIDNANEHDYEVIGNGFIPYLYHFEDIIHCLLCLPIDPIPNKQRLKKHHA